MKRTITISYFLLFGVLCLLGQHTPFHIDNENTVGITIYDKSPIVESAFRMLDNDVSAVLSCQLLRKTDDANILAGTYNHGIEKYCSEDDTVFLSDTKEGFVLKVLHTGKLVIAGSDSHGTAYGLLELSRLLGVSPWEWWADAIPEKKNVFELTSDFVTRQAPSVEYRGIFINDEDWGLMPWSSMTMEPENAHGVIGAATTERIFQLLLRLRANTYWPPMHECSEPFFFTSGNREMAERYGIYIGGSHCEPMASSTAVEWGRRGFGEYDYVNNRENVLSFWEDRIKNVAGQEILYTLGMRGVHDGAMNGAHSVEEQKTVLAKVFTDQRYLLSKYVNNDVTKVPQVFIPYKEVLDVYNAGLDVPEDVTLMWCDDNYGYIRHFPTDKERNRKGGNGIYYHVSYWGRPHDYLWLGTFSPYLLYHQLSEAYKRGIQKLWILNVGDIKPAEYQIELFMDMAWNMKKVTEQGVSVHLNNFLSREFGGETATDISQIMNEHYRLAFIRRPEFLGNTRCEEYGPESAKWYKISDLPWTDEYIENRINEYICLSDKAEQISEVIRDDRADTYFQLVKYPIQASAEMNKKMLYGQLARHGRMGWDKSNEAYDSIVALTKMYNNGFNNGGKWNGIMDFQPRKQPVFEPLAEETCEAPLIASTETIDIRLHRGDKTIEHVGLGTSTHAIEIPKGSSITFTLAPKKEDKLNVRFSFLPNHPIDNDGLVFMASMNNATPQTIDYATYGRSEEWKENILNARATRTTTFDISPGKQSELKITALTEGIILDGVEIITDYKP